MYYRKRPVVIEARQLGHDYVEDTAIMRWCGGQHEFSDGIELFYIETPGGRIAAVAGDWVIRGVKGEFYPCKPDIFEATYELEDE